MVRNYNGNTKWIPGTVSKKLGPVTYSVAIGDRQMVKRHIDQERQNIHHSLKSISNQFDAYYYLYEPVTPVQDVDPILQTPARSLEQE